MFNTLLVGGIIVDGTGNVGFPGAVAIESDRIRIITGDVSSIDAGHILDVSGCMVTPGFIDVHTHSDLMTLAEPLNEPKVYQGITTELVGQDGVGYAPLSESSLLTMVRYYAGINGNPPLDYNWRSMAQYLQRFEGTTAVNIGSLMPNSCPRLEVIGWDNRPATTDEIRRMQEIVSQSMSEGALGLSSGLNYAPGVYASTDELIQLCKTVAAHGGIYCTHVRYDLGDRAFDPFREAITIGKRSGCPVQLTHYATNYATRGKADRLLELVENARITGLDVTVDSYPWPAGSTVLHMCVPIWAHDGGPQALLERLKNPGERARMRTQGLNSILNYSEMVISAIGTEKNRWCEGRTVAEIADELDKDPWDTVCDLIIEEDLYVSYYVFSGHMDDVKLIMRHPSQMFCSDGLRVGGHPNPRTYGTYPKVLGQMVRDEKVLPMEQAIRKMTSFPAQRFGLQDRGVLRDGMKADVVVFDPLTVSSTATFENPKQYPLGIEYVFVNGEMVVEQGTHTGATPGRSVRRRV